jgi:hypothetical protein
MAPRVRTDDDDGRGDSDTQRTKSNADSHGSLRRTAVDQDAGSTQPINGRFPEMAAARERLTRSTAANAGA